MDRVIFVSNTYRLIRLYSFELSEITSVKFDYFKLRNSTHHNIMKFIYKDPADCSVIVIPCRMMKKSLIIFHNIRITGIQHP